MKDLIGCCIIWAGALDRRGGHATREHHAEPYRPCGCQCPQDALHSRARVHAREHLRTTGRTHVPRVPSTSRSAIPRQEEGHSMTIVQHTDNVAAGVEVQPGKVLAFLGLSPDDPKSQALVAVCQRYDLDPLLKHVVIIPGSGPYITRDGLLHVAHRSGQLDGIEVTQEPTLSDDGKEWVCRVAVYRKDMSRPFAYPGRYAAAGKNREYAQEMSLKAAEAHALRRAFDVTGLPAIDEQRPSDNAPAPASNLRAALNRDEVPVAPPERAEDVTDAELIDDPTLDPAWGGEDVA